MIEMISAAIGNSWSIAGENEFILWFQSLAGKGTFLYYLMNFFSMLGEETVLVAVVGIVYWGLDKRRGEAIGVGMIGATIFNPLLKNIVRRTRPFDAHPEIQNLRDVDGYSFPSGHSANSAATYFGTAFVYRDKQKKWLIAIAVVLPLMVALSRTYLGAHYPTDVICGLLMGTASVLFVDLVRRVLKNKYWTYGILAVVGFSGFFYCTTEDFFTAYGLMIGFALGILFEEKVTKFENTKVWWRIVLRVGVGGVLFLGINELTKLIVGAIYPSYEQNVWFEHIFRVLRYAVITFVAIGVYPLLFAQTEKLWKKWGWIKTKTEPTETVSERTIVDHE